MITEFLLIAAAGIYDPMDMSGHSMYPSGVKEMDKFPRYEYSATKLAKFSLPRDIYDKNGTLIKAGHYLAGLSIGRGEILIFEGEKEIYSVKVTRSVIMEKPLRFSTAEFYSKTPDTGVIILTQNKYKVLGRVPLVR